MSKPSIYTDMRLAPSLVKTKSVTIVANLAIGGVASPESPLRVWSGTAWVSLPGPPTT
jgi:hypothetical protein